MVEPARLDLHNVMAWMCSQLKLDRPDLCKTDTLVECNRQGNDMSKHPYKSTRPASACSACLSRATLHRICGLPAAPRNTPAAPLLAHTTYICASGNSYCPYGQLPLQPTPRTLPWMASPVQNIRAPRAHCHGAVAQPVHALTAQHGILIQHAPDVCSFPYSSASAFLSAFCHASARKSRLLPPGRAKEAAHPAWALLCAQRKCPAA